MRQGVGRKECILWSFKICTASQILGYQRTVTKCVRNVACMRVKVILNRFLIARREGKSAFRRPVWIWEYNIEVDVKVLYQDGIWLIILWKSFEWRSHEFCNKLISIKCGNILISWATIGISGNSVHWMCLVLWSAGYFSLLWSVVYCSVLCSAAYCSVLWSTAYCSLLWSAAYC